MAKRVPVVLVECAGGSVFANIAWFVYAECVYMCVYNGVCVCVCICAYVHMCVCI